MNDLPVQTEEYAVFWIMLRSAARSLILLLVALPLIRGGRAEAMAPAPTYTTSLTLQPSLHAQIRTFQFPPHPLECAAIARVRKELKKVPCYDVMTIQLGPFIWRGKDKIGYASIRQCVGRLTSDQVNQGCYQFLQTCIAHSTSTCPPAWSAQTSIEFRTNGKQVRKRWITCGMGIFVTFQYHLHWCGATAAPPPNRVGWLAVGDDYEVNIPGQVQVGTEERFLLRPDGGLIFEGCCS